MDEIYLDYDPRNAIGFRPGAQPGRPFTPFAYGGAGLPQRPPVVSRPQAQPQPVYYPQPKAQPIYLPQPQPQPIYYAQPMAAPDSAFRRRLSDLTVGDVVPLLAQALIAFRPTPTPPGDEGRVETNVVNLTKFLDAIARKFHVDQQLNAAGAFAGTFLR